jgi:high affinity Mn2+ porin
MRSLRTYFSGSHSEAIDLTLLNQFLKNLTHNADRGPVSIFSTRLHGEF